MNEELNIDTVQFPITAVDLVAAATGMSRDEAVTAIEQEIISIDGDRVKIDRVYEAGSDVLDMVLGVMTRLRWQRRFIRFVATYEGITAS